MIEIIISAQALLVVVARQTGVFTSRLGCKRRLNFGLTGRRLFRYYTLAAKRARTSLHTPQECSHTCLVGLLTC